jgi:ParB/RepB/Spo0J family partition protein
MKKTNVKDIKKREQNAEIPLSEIFPNPDQPRKEFDAEKLAELAGSIKNHGVIEPIVVTPREGRYMIIAGERRYRASLLAGLKTIPAGGHRDNALVEELALIENIQRQDLNPIEEGKAYANLLKKYSVEELAKKLGYKKTGPILDRTQLLDLAPEYQEMVVKGTLSTSEAYEMSRLPVDKQQGVFLKLQRGELNSYNKLFAYVQGVINLAAQEEIFALAPLSEKEQESIASLSSLIASIERFIGKVQEQDKAKHLEKAVFHSDVSPERIDFIIGSLQRIRRTILVGDGVKKAMQAHRGARWRSKDGRVREAKNDLRFAPPV